MISFNNQISLRMELVCYITSLDRVVSRIVDVFLSTINPTAGPDGCTTVVIPLEAYLTLTGHHAKKPDYRCVDAELEELLDQRVMLNGEEVQLFETATREVDITAEQVIRLKCSAAAVPLFFELGKGAQYYAFRLGEVITLSAQAYALFLFVLSHSYLNRPVTVSKEQLINVIHLRGTSSHALIERAQSAVEQINAQTRFHISFQKNIRRGLVSLTFNVGINEHWVNPQNRRDDWPATVYQPQNMSATADSVPKWAERVLIASEYHRLKKLSKDYLRKECCGVREPDDSDAEELVKTLLEEAQNRNVSHFHAYISKQLHSMLQQIVSPATVQPKVNKSTQYLKHGELSPMMRQAIQKALESESDLEQASVSDLNQDN